MKYIVISIIFYLNDNILLLILYNENPGNNINHIHFLSAKL